MKKFFSYIAGTFFAAAMMQMVWMLVTKAYADYGWLGAFVVISIGLPFGAVLVPLLAWWLFPGIQSSILYSLLALAIFFGFLSSKTSE